MFENGWKEEKSLKTAPPKLDWPAFRGAKHPKAGQNTQHTSCITGTPPKWPVG